jgi:hypothetical protein
MKKRILVFLAGLLFLVPATGMAMKKDGSEIEKVESLLIKVLTGLSECVDKKKCIHGIVNVLLGKISWSNALIKSLNLKKIAEKSGFEEKYLEELLVKLTTTPKKNKITQFLEKLPPQLIDQIKGGILGSGTVVVLWLLGHGICHPCMEFFEPQSFLTTIPLALALGAGVYEVIKSLTVRNTYQNLVLNTILPIGTWVLSKFISSQDEDSAIEEDDEGSDVLEKEDTSLKKKKSTITFDEFANTLEEAQIKLLPEPSTLFLAEHNPKLLLPCTEFIRSLNKEQIEMFFNII